MPNYVLDSLQASDGFPGDGVYAIERVTGYGGVVYSIESIGLDNPPVYGGAVKPTPNIAKFTDSPEPEYAQPLVYSTYWVQVDYKRDPEDTHSYRVIKEVQAQNPAQALHTAIEGHPYALTAHINQCEP